MIKRTISSAALAGYSLPALFCACTGKENTEPSGSRDSDARSVSRRLINAV